MNTRFSEQIDALYVAKENMGKWLFHSIWIYVVFDALYIDKTVLQLKCDGYIYNNIKYIYSNYVYII